MMKIFDDRAYRNKYHASMRIQGSWALVTGASNRIGKAISLHLAGCGANLILHCRHSNPEIENLKKQITDSGLKAEILTANFNDESQVDALLNQIETRRDLSILIQSAAIFEPESNQNTLKINLQTSARINAQVPMRLSWSFASTREKASKIIHITDWSTKRPYRDYASYGMSKAALENATRSIALRFGPKVTCNALAPGPIEPSIHMNSEQSKKIASLTLLNRWGGYQSITSAAQFILENDFINATTLVVDGGRSLS